MDTRHQGLVFSAYHLIFWHEATWLRCADIIIWIVRNFSVKRNGYVELLGPFKKISQGYLWKLEFKYFDIKLFYVTAIVLLLPEMYRCYVLFPTDTKKVWESFGIFTKVWIKKYSEIQLCHFTATVFLVPAMLWLLGTFPKNENVWQSSRILL